MAKRAAKKAVRRAGAIGAGRLASQMVEDRRALYPRFSEAEYDRRYGAIRAEMSRRGLDALVIFGDSGHSRYNQANVHYVSNYVDQLYSYVVFPFHGEPTLFACLYCHVPNARLISGVKDVRWGGWNMSEAVADRLGELNLGRGRVGLVGVNTYHKITIPWDHYETLRSRFPEARLEPATEILEDLRMIKSAEEVAALERGAAFTDMGVRAFVAAVRPGVKEHQLAAKLMNAYLKEGGLYHFQLVGSHNPRDPFMPYPWPFHSNRTLRKGDIAMTEISASYNYYAGQVIRTVSIGKAPQAYRDLFQVSQEVYHGVLEALQPGNTTQDVLRVTKKIADAGYTIHAPVVHGWGQNLMKPFIGLPGMSEWRSDPVTFQPGMVIMIEPNPVTKDERHGVFLGNLTVIEEKGARSLQKFPIKLFEV